MGIIFMIGFKKVQVFGNLVIKKVFEKRVELKKIQIKLNILSIIKIGVFVDNLILIEFLIYFLYKEKIKKDSLKRFC